MQFLKKLIYQLTILILVVPTIYEGAAAQSEEASEEIEENMEDLAKYVAEGIIDLVN